MYRVLAKDRDQRFQTMADLREALLDPERYASSAPDVGIPDDLSGIARAAAPMARAELEARSALGHPSQIVTPPPTGGTPSGRGELIENIDNLIRTKPGSRLVLLLGLASATVAMFAVFGRQETAPPAPGGQPAASPRDHPRELQLRSRRRGGGARGRQDAGADAAVDRGRLQRLGRRVPVQEDRATSPRRCTSSPTSPSPLFATLRRADIEPAAVEGAGGSTGEKRPPPARHRSHARPSRRSRGCPASGKRTTRTASSSPQIHSSREPSSRP